MLHNINYMNIAKNRNYAFIIIVHNKNKYVIKFSCMNKLIIRERQQHNRRYTCLFKRQSEIK